MDGTKTMPAAATFRGARRAAGGGRHRRKRPPRAAHRSRARTRLSGPARLRRGPGLARLLLFVLVMPLSCARTPGSAMGGNQPAPRATAAAEARAADPAAPTPQDVAAKPARPVAPFLGLEGFVPPTARTPDAALYPHVARALHEFDGLCQGACPSALRFEPTGEVRRHAVAWEMVPWTCEEAATSETRGGELLGRWRLVDGALELRREGESWIRVSVKFDGVKPSLKQRGTRVPHAICLQGGPWPGCWTPVHEQRRTVEDCEAEEEFSG